MIPRAEHPRPNFFRENWTNLNGEWEFYIDNSNSGADRKVYLNDKLDGKIIVPFCPESVLSGVHNLDFMECVWYAKNIEIAKNQLKGHLFLHFGASDYETTLYVNGQKVGVHVGGYTSFSFDIVKFLQEGNNRIVVRVVDKTRSGLQPTGKQCHEYYSKECDYTRTTGIWQTVWLEEVGDNYIEKVKVNATNLDGKVIIDAKLNKYAKDAKLKVQVSFKGEQVLDNTFNLDGVNNNIIFDVSPIYLWNVGEPNLYDIKYILLIDGQVCDEVIGYFGIRRIDIDGFKVRINGKSVFQRLILDQGFYPDGIYTAPTDEALKADIELSMNLGFNGARLHQKVFEERFFYHADKMGYLVWGEYANWGIDICSPNTLHTFLPQWLESVERDYNHPSLIGWCPFNETWEAHGNRQLNSNISLVYQATKNIDNTRPVIDTSGHYHTEKTDIFDIHDYTHDIPLFKERYDKHANGEHYNTYPKRQTYDGVSPYFISEYGGIKWHESFAKENDAKVSWGYGDAPKSMDEFCKIYCGITEVMLDNPTIMGFCYTQLVDVEQEQNGLYYYDRSKKFTNVYYERIRKTNTKKAKIEEE